METHIGIFLRELRAARQWSMNRLAERAGVAQPTLSRWESGAFQPRLPELEAVLDALGASPAQREQALALIDAPRAAQQVRKEAQARAAALGGEWVFSSGSGDLLRALRHRGTLSQEQVAARLGVQPSTVSRWERSEASPPAERLPALLDLLRAHPQERAALAEGRLWITPPGETAVSLDECASRVATLAAQTERGEQTLMDLRFLAVESQLWPLALRRPSARRLLAEACAWHARWLSYRERIAEAGRLAECALDMAGREFLPEPFYMWAVFVSAVRAAGGKRRTTPARAVDALRVWLPHAARPEYASWICRDMAEFASASGRTEAALGFIAWAREAAERTEDEDCVRLSKHVHATVLLRAGRPREALPILPPDSSPVFINAFFQAIRWAEALLAVGDKSGARDWLSRGYEAARAYDLPREPCDQLARHL